MGTIPAVVKSFVAIAQPVFMSRNECWISFGATYTISPAITDNS